MIVKKKFWRKYARNVVYLEAKYTIFRKCSYGCVCVCVCVCVDFLVYFMRFFNFENFYFRYF